MTKITIELDDWTLLQLAKIAADKEQTIQQVIINILEDYVKSHESD